MIERLLTIEQVAEILQITPKTVRQLPIECSRIGKQLRYKPEDVSRYINSTRENLIDGQEKHSRRLLSKRSKMLATPKILSWEDLQRIPCNGGRG
jgi:hypothetical protein